MNTRIFYAVLPLAALFSADAFAQTVVTQRAPQLTQDQQTTVYRTVVREKKVVPQTRPVVRRHVVKQTIRKPAPNVVRVTATERVVTRPRTVTRRVIAAPRTTTLVTADPLDLTPDQRTFVYRTLVQQPLQPAPVVTERIVPAPFPRPYVTTEPYQRPYVTEPYQRPYVTEPYQRPYVTESYQRPYVTTEPVVTTAPRVITVPQSTGVGTVIANDRVTRTGPEIMIGTRLPASVPLYAMPASAAAAAPSLEAYNYALIGDRIYLVDPRDGIVVGMLYQ